MKFIATILLAALVVCSSVSAQAPHPTPNWINIKAPPFNARGNNSTDDTAAIQAAIDYAFASSLGAVYCPAGNYKISGTIYLLPPGDPNRPNASGAAISGSKIAFFGDPVGVNAPNPTCQISPTFTAVVYGQPGACNPNANCNVTGVWSFATVTGTREPVSLTSNNYTATSADCGKIKTLPTGTTPTVTLPNLNQECTIEFETVAAISYQFIAAVGGSLQNSQNSTQTRGAAAGDTVRADIVTPSVSAAKWNLSGDLTSISGSATASLSATPTSISSGSSSTLTWSSTGAASCTSPGSLGNTAIPSFSGATSGSISTGSLTTTTTYSIQCATATAAATVTVTGGPQTISSVQLSATATTTGLASGTAVGTLSVPMSPASPAFSYTGTNLHLSTVGTDSGGVCNSTNGANNGSFQIGSGDTLQTSGTLTAGNKAICVAAGESGVSATGQAFTITVGNLINAATTYCAANGGGSGTSASPWRYNCIQAAVNAAGVGDTVLLAGGNWRLDTADAAPVSINKSTVSLVGVGSGNTFDSYGHINNAAGTTQCPTAGTSITCVYQTGNSYQPSGLNGTGGGALAPGGYIRVGADGAQAPNCISETVANIFFDGSLVSAGGNAWGTLAMENCAGPLTVNNIRFLTYGNTSLNTGTCPGVSCPCPGPISSCGNTETQFWVDGSKNITITNSMFANPLYLSAYHSGQAFESVVNNGITLINNYFWQGVYNPTSDDNVTFIGNYTDMSQGNFDPAFGVTGCGLNPGGIAGHECPATGGLTGSFHATFNNNYQTGGSSGMSIGVGVNDPNTNGNVSDLHLTGNWVNGSTSTIDSCVWRIFADQSNCSSQGMIINAQATGASPNQCSTITYNGNTFAITNNSIIGTVAAELEAQATGTTPCYDTAHPGPCPGGSCFTIPLRVYGFVANSNYLSSPSNQYNSNSNTIGASIGSGSQANFCAGGGAGTVPNCATSGFTTPPTVSFTLGALSGTTMPFATTSFTAQYGAVRWLTSTSSTTPTSSGQAGTGAVWSYTPPVSLSGVAHGNTVYMWTMDSANNISSTVSALIP